LCTCQLLPLSFIPLLFVPLLFVPLPFVPLPFVPLPFVPVSFYPCHLYPSVFTPVICTPFICTPVTSPYSLYDKRSSLSCHSNNGEEIKFCHLDNRRRKFRRRSTTTFLEVSPFRRRQEPEQMTTKKIRLGPFPVSYSSGLFAIVSYASVWSVTYDRNN
jgi:hypothetical protein